MKRIDLDRLVFAVTMLILIAWAHCLNLSRSRPADAPVPTEPSAAYELTEETEAPTEAVTEPQTEPVETTEATEPPVDEEMAEMLAILIYQEAGGDASCDDCRRRVADVALNRVEDPRFPDTLEGVLLHQGQYGRLHWTGIQWPDRAANPGESHAVERARRIAHEVLQGQHSELYGQSYIWQAGFHQGADEVYHCGTYFGR